MEYEIRVLRPTDKRSPFVEWLRSLKDPLTRRRVLKRFTRVELGNFGDHRILTGGIIELRFDMGPGYRIYFAISDNELVVLLAGGDKHSQDDDIALAHKLWQENKNDVNSFARGI